jgi:hypothetical protein
MSRDSRQLVRNHERFADASLGKDPFILVLIARDTHLYGVCGSNEEMKRAQKAEEIIKFEQLKQLPTQSIASFKEAYDRATISLEGLGVPRVSPEDEAMRFLYKLNGKFKGMMVSMRNSTHSGSRYPVTLHAAYSVASTWSDDGKEAANDNMHSVFTLVDDRQLKANNDKDRSNSGGRGVRGGRGGRGGKEGRESYKEDRECHHCHKVGHLQWNCPDKDKTKKKATVLVTEDKAIGGDDEADDESINVDYRAFITDQHFMLHFSPTTILLDSQGGKCLVSNRDLIDSTLSDIEPYCIGGIDANSPGFDVVEAGFMKDFGKTPIGFSSRAVANVLSQAMLVDHGADVTYDKHNDRYVVTSGTTGNVLVFHRSQLPNGQKSNHYAHDTANPVILVETVRENMRRLTARELKDAKVGIKFMENMGGLATQGAIEMVNHGIKNSPLTTAMLRNAHLITGPDISSLKSNARKLKAKPVANDLSPRVVQKEQSLSLDVIWIKGVQFLSGLLDPLNLILAKHITSRDAATIKAGIDYFRAAAKSRDFDIKTITVDNEGAIAKIEGDLNQLGIAVETCAPGKHVPKMEAANKKIKMKFRWQEHHLPFLMCTTLIIACVAFCVSRLNLRPTQQSTDFVSATEQFTGRKLEWSDLKYGFGEYCQAINRDTDNTMTARTQGCIVLLPVGNLSHSVKMLSLSSKKIITRDQFTVLPMPDLVISYLNNLAEAEGYSRGDDPSLGPLQDVEDDLPDLTKMPTMMDIDSRPDIMQHVPQYYVPPAAGVDGYIRDAVQPREPAEEAITEVEMVSAARVEVQESATVEAEEQRQHLPAQRHPWHYDPSEADSLQGIRGARVLVVGDDASRAEIRRQLLKRKDWIDKDYAFTMSVRAALRERGEEARPVIMAELQQMMDKKVWHGVIASGLTKSQRRAIIRSSMFLKDKYLASGAFDRFKARLVAGGDMQDKELYENLSSPTAATTSVMTVAAIAASEGRIVVVIDIGGAFLNADMGPAGVVVHMRLDKVMTAMIIQIDPSYSQYVDENGAMVVGLDKALYGLVEASALWYEDIRSKLFRNGFVENPYDVCVFNKAEADGSQTTVVLHVDDLMVTSVNQCNLDSFGKYLKSVYPETRTNSGVILDYVGMTFDFTIPGEVRVTMDNCVNDILSGSGVTKTRVTPAASTLFDTRDAKKATDVEAKWFHTHVAKVLYLAKRVRPECLTAVAFLSTRVQVCDIDDLAKLTRLLGYLRHTRDRGIILRIGEHMDVKAYIDAAYGVHQQSGKSHTGCVIVLGEAGPLFAKSGKQKIVTKSSTEAELVGLSDTASQAIHLRNFVIAQGYVLGPAIIYQDNMSCMALMKRGGPGSERSRHINIRHFWLSEKVADKEVIIEHLGTKKMFANVLTKPVQGAQFVCERNGLTNWH